MKLVFNDDDQHDPYGAVIEGINMALRFGFDHQGAMNETEYEVLKKIQDLLHKEDPLSTPKE